MQTCLSWKEPTQGWSLEARIRLRWMCVFVILVWKSIQIKVCKTDCSSTTAMTCCLACQSAKNLKHFCTENYDNKSPLCGHAQFEQKDLSTRWGVQTVCSGTELDSVICTRLHCRSRRQQPLPSSVQMSQSEQDAANGNLEKRAKLPLNGGQPRVLPSEGNPPVRCARARCVPHWGGEGSVWYIGTLFMPALKNFCFG